MPKSDKNISKTKSKAITKTKTKAKTKSPSNSILKKFEKEMGCGNVFKDVGFSDAEAANLQARCDLMRALQTIIKKNGWTQAEAAKKLKVGQPRVAEILHSQSKLFSVDLLIKYLARLGVQVDFKFSKIDWN